MRYMVRTVDWSLERKDNVAIMKATIPQLEIVMDRKHDGYASLFLACKLLGDTGGVLMEDDIKLCKNFTKRIEEKVVELGNQYVINFFERPKVKFETELAPGSQFFWQQCVYFPPMIMHSFEKWFNQFKIDKPEMVGGMATDRLIGYALGKEKVKYWRVNPRYVQHLDFKSVINSRSSKRQSPYFIDDVEG